MISDARAREFINLLSSAGFGYNNPKPLQAKFYADGISELKKYEAPSDSDLTDEELFELYQAIADLHQFDSNEEEKILYQLRSLSYKPFEVGAKISYLSSLLNYIKSHRNQLGVDEVNLLKEEISRFKDYAEMKYGRENELTTKSMMILEELNSVYPENSSTGVTAFMKKWEEVNQKFRPDDQALDYASQLIYKIMNSPY